MCVYMLGFAQLKVNSSFVYLFIVILVFKKNPQFNIKHVA